MYGVPFESWIEFLWPRLAVGVSCRRELSWAYKSLLKISPKTCHFRDCADLEVLADWSSFQMALSWLQPSVWRDSTRLSSPLVWEASQILDLILLAHHRHRTQTFSALLPLNWQSFLSLCNSFLASILLWSHWRIWKDERPLHLQFPDHISSRDVP